jgi:cardiolipin synthase
MELDLLVYASTIIVALYVIGASIFLILDNRSPHSTFAWLFLFILLPVIGVIIYVFIGRDWKAFSHERKLIRQEIGGELIDLLGPLQEREKEVIERLAKEKPDSFKHKLLQLVDQNSTSLLTGYNELEILQDAAEKYPRLLTDLKQARHSIHMEYYIWTDDDFTRQVKEVLIERAKAGVEVRCLYDASGGKLGRSYLRELTEAGVEILPYLEYRKLTKLHTINYRSHRKIVIIDGKIGYVGGLNLDQDQLDGGKYFDCWRDSHLRIRGEAALALQAIFLVSWYNTTQEKLLNAAYFPLVGEEIDTFLPVQITTAGPDSQWGAIRQLYFYMIMAAQKKVYIQSPFFIPDESISEAIKAVALAGVEVKLMCAPRGTTYTIPYWAANTYFADMARAGVKIYLYQKGYFHPKTLNIDTAICTIGTANMDIRSFSINYEVNAVIYDQEKARELEQDFLNDLQYCTEWTLEEYKSRNVLLRLRDSVCRLASPLL